MYGLDISKEMIDYAKEQGEEGITYVKADFAEDIPEELKDVKFDVIYAIYIYQYAKNRTMLAKFISNTNKLLKPGGKLYILNPRFPDLDLYKESV